MVDRTHVMVGIVTVLSLVSASCAETSSESRGAPPEPQTIDEFMGWDEVGEEAEYQAASDLQTRIEVKLVECMADRGLEYAPYEGPTGERPVLGEGLSDSEFMREYGYGVFTGMLEEARWNTEEQDFEGLEPDEWYWSFADDPDFMAALDECTIQVEEELGRPDPEDFETLTVSLDEAWGSLESEREDVQERIESDSRYVEVEEAWSACMGDRGFDFSTQQDVEAHLMAKRYEYEEEANLGTLVLTAAFEKGLQPFVSEELAIAAADLECRPELDNVRRELQLEYEGWFIEDHRSELEKIRELERRRMELAMQGSQY